MQVFFTGLSSACLHAFKLALVFLIVQPASLFADDIDSYKQKSCGSVPSYRFVFIVDNSGSMSEIEFNQSRDTINATIERVLNSMPEAKVAVVQFGTDGIAIPPIHDYHVTVPFTNDKTAATGWNRAYGTGGTVQSSYTEDHIPAILSRMRLDDVYDSGNALDITDAENVQFVLFSDAGRDITGSCCSSLVAEGTDHIPASVYPMFGEYDALKDGSVLPGGLKAQFTILHVPYAPSASEAAAAIASVGGDFSGTVEFNTNDPDGAAATPRRYVEGNFSPSDTTGIVDLIDKVIAESYVPPDIESESYAEISVDISSASNWSTDNRAYLSLFKPSSNRAWNGNIKGYFFGDSGLEDTNGNDAVITTADGAVFTDTAQSFWSASADGNDTESGGANEQMSAARSLYTSVAASPDLNIPGNALDSTNSNISNAMLGAGSDAERVNALDWLQTAPMGDPLHTKPVVVRYATKTVVYGMTNQGLLHAIDATVPTTTGVHSGGDELWAFMPKELLVNLPLLSASPTAGDHIYGLDGTITRWHEDSNDDNLVNNGEKVLLFFGMRRGGQNYYALDVSNPASPILKWQIFGGVTSGYLEMAQTWSKMILTTVKDGPAKKVLIVGGGYDVTEDTKTARSAGSGNRVYVIEADTGNLLWSVGAGAAHYNSASMIYSIASDISVIDTNGNGYADRLYFGDMGGQVWRVAFSESNNASGQPTVNFDNAPSVTKIADFGSSARRQFFYPPAVALMRQQGQKYLAITLGSGNRTDPLNTSTQDWMLMIRDPVDSPLNNALSLTDLYDATDNLVMEGSDKTAERAALATKNGWKLKLKPGEKSLSPPIIYENKLRFTSYEPAVSTDSTGCTVTSSTSRYYVINLSDATPSSDAPIDESALTKNHRSTEIGTLGIPSSPILAFPPNKDAVEIYVGKEKVGNSPQTVKRVFWKQLM